MTPAERSQRARLAAHVLHAHIDAKQHTRAARSAFLERFEREVDPDGVLPPEERRRRAEHAKKAYFTRLAMKSAKSRRKSEGPDRSRGLATNSLTLGRHHPASDNRRSDEETTDGPDST